MKKIFLTLMISFLCTTVSFCFDSAQVSYSEKEHYQFEQLLKEAESGDPHSQYQLAIKYMFKSHYKQGQKSKHPDYKSALEWLSKSSENGHAESQFMLSKLYELGKGTKKNFEKAMYWYKKGVKNEDKNAKSISIFVKEHVKEREFPVIFRPLKEYKHEPFRIGACKVCHVNYASNPKELITNNTSELCYKCHQKKDIQRYDNAHEPVTDNRCTDCHDPHQSNTKRLIKESSINDLCLKCHDLAKKTTSIKSHIDMNKKYKHDPVDKSCIKCHEAHTSKYKKLLKSDDGKMNQCLECHKDLNSHISSVKYKHSPVQNSENRCLECHDVHSSDHKKLLQKEVVSLCLDCHNKSIKSDEDGRILLNISKHLDKHPNWHKPIKEGGCVVCHDSHGSKNFSILKKAFKENFDKEATAIKEKFNKKFYANFDKNDFLCFNCHKNNKIDERINRDTNFRDGDFNLHYIHVNYKKGRSCKTCHDVHASKKSHMIRDYTIKGKDNKFPLRHITTKTGGSCTSACHTKREYDRQTPKGFGIVKKEVKESDKKPKSLLEILKREY